MHLIVDHREAKSGIVEYFKKMKETTYSFGCLPVGDYLVDNQLLFERKTVRDFAVSLVDGRLFNQALRLLSSPYRSIFVLEGTVSNLQALGMRRESIQGAIISLTVLLGIPLLRSLSLEETARLISYTSMQMQRDTRGAINRAGYRPRGKRKQQLYILQGLPGIGPARAEELLKTFGSIQAVVSASKLELSKVTGVGAKTANRIYTLVN